jgi:hypothetical protein
LATALVSLEGVLMKENGDPIPEGVKLYRVLCEHYRIVLCSDMSQERTDHWLRSNLIVGYGDIYDNRFFFEGQDLRSRQLSIARSHGLVELFVDPDADRCAEALQLGVTTILFASPKFVRTVRKVRPWEDMKNEVERQKNALLDAHLGSQIKRFQ